jgi:hypothetical protein
MTALAGQVLLIASNLRDGLERVLEADLDPKLREAIERAKSEAEVLIECARRANTQRDT